MLSYHENSHYNSVHDQEVFKRFEEGKRETTHQSTLRNEIKLKGKQTKLVENSNGVSHKGSEKGTEYSGKPKRNDLCSCGSGLRYKKCCMAIEKSRKKSIQFRERRNSSFDSKENIVHDEIPEPLEGGFSVLNI